MSEKAYLALSGGKGKGKQGKWEQFWKFLCSQLMFYY
jgi:hypothetical protein